jgi:hypothetical protein
VSRGSCCSQGSGCAKGSGPSGQRSSCNTIGSNDIGVSVHYADDTLPKN